MNTSIISHQPSASYRPFAPHISKRPSLPPFAGLKLLTIIDNDWDGRIPTRHRVNTSPGWREDYPDVEKMLNAHFQ